MERAMKFTDSILDVAREHYSSEIFEDYTDSQPELQPKVKNEILEEVDEYKQFGTVQAVNLIGSILTKRYDENADLDITVVMAFGDELAKDKAVEKSIASQDKYNLSGTEHPINIYVREDAPVEKWDNIYDVLEDRWIKQTGIDYPDLAVYIKRFAQTLRTIDLEKGKLERDLIDYKELENIPEDEVQGIKELVEVKLHRIDSQVKKLVSFYRIIASLRRSLFTKNYTPEQLREIGSRDILPANILYKLLEKYHYLEFLKNLDKILKRAEGTMDTDKEIEDLFNFIEEHLEEITTSGACGAYEVPLGATPQAQKYGYVGGPINSKKKKKKRKKKKDQV